MLSFNIFVPRKGELILFNYYFLLLNLNTTFAPQLTILFTL